MYVKFQRTWAGEGAGTKRSAADSLTNGDVVARSCVLDQEVRGRRGDDISWLVAAGATVEGSSNRWGLALLDGRAGAGGRNSSEKEGSSDGELHLDNEIDWWIGFLKLGLDLETENG
jgi:hypothetical protein